MVADTVYPGVSLPATALRDHFEDSRWQVTEADIGSTMDRRMFDRIYGEMPFLDNLEQPARTCTATRAHGSRATVVIPCDSSDGPKCSTLKVRECADAQGFPITLQFRADSMRGKDFLGGNAVAPRVVRAIATSMLKAEGLAAPVSPLGAEPWEPPPVLDHHRSTGKRFSMRRRLRGSAPIDWRRDHRGELDSGLPGVRSQLPDCVMPPVTWRARICSGYATQSRCYEPKLGDALRLAQLLTPQVEGKDADASPHILLSVVRRCLNGFPDGVTLQEDWTGRRSTRLGPGRLLQPVASGVDGAIPLGSYKRRTISAVELAPALKSCLRFSGDEATPEPSVGASVRLLTAAIALSAHYDRLTHGTSRIQPRLRPVLSKLGVRLARFERKVRHSPIFATRVSSRAVLNA